ncbi:dipeptide/oligopeptide/nickel ABC transporter permease/ATP-binding protein [Nocardiopsis sp. JB363]|uniref:dipeptide/oligopeptide/nickel ABC transporter permease/ATP-binding protein n=1 Tax=Nocardiopsis sp. JB363 TaxID=1434837 RepID=UPI00097A53CD|nr:dipeptide/oligopeptide/nickel ABC transporter permease/ATP-binding protein [Nocardiopsis sp. JB363]SIO88752.1 Oligopeptide transport ATP-binding protein OppD (TC 3.A.1.5.1) [Nocardiopsis sp. JB363]
MKRFVGPAGLTAILGTAVLMVIAFAGPGIWGEAATARSVPDRWTPAGAEFLFGTDDLGRDIFARVMVATRMSLLLTLGATAIGVTGGVIVGLTASILPKYPRRILIWLMDMLLAFPWLLLVLFFTVIWGATATGAMFAIGLAGIPNLTRLVYNLASSVSGQDYVRAARVVGVGPLGVLFRHILPNIANPLLVQVSASASVTLLSFAGLSFLGLGVQAPAYDWGRLINEGIGHIYTNPMAAIGPGVAIVFAGLVFTMIAEALADRPGQGLRGVAAAGRASLFPRGPGRKTRSDAAAVAPPVGGVDPGGDGTALAQVTDLSVSFPDGEGGFVERVRGVNLSVRPGEIVGIVGESGSGKSLTAMALAGLSDDRAIVKARTRRFDDIDLGTPLSRKEGKRLGTELGIVFQDPLTSLNPALRIGRQLTEVSRTHLGMSREEARQRAESGLDAVGIAEPRRRLKDYPHEFSGGMRQRAMIGMALTAGPRLIIADEPTTALDVTVQKQVLDVLHRAQRATDTAIVLISHDVALVSGFCDRVVVMKDGEVVENLDARRIREEARHPYTRGLIACLPDMRSDRTRPLPVIDDRSGPGEQDAGTPEVGAVSGAVRAGEESPL